MATEEKDAPEGSEFPPPESDGARVAFVIPVHPKHYGFVENFLAKHDVISRVCDVILVFSSEEDYEAFKSKEKIKKIIIDKKTKTNNIVTFKKFYALEKLQNSKYEYFIVCDAEIDIIIKNFNEKNVLKKIQSIFENKKIYGGVSPSNQNITKTSASVFLDADVFETLRSKTMDFNMYYWFSDLPVYRRSDLADFFCKISYENICWFHFDHKIYLNYLIAYHGFEIVNITPSLNIEWSLEYNCSGKVDFLKSHGYGFGWVTPRMFRNNKKAMLREGAFLMYHMDRYWGDYDRCVYDASYEDLEVAEGFDIVAYDVYSRNFENINEILEHFEKDTYASMVSIDKKNKIGYFKIKNENIYDSQYESNITKKINFVTIKKKNKKTKNSILICTYKKHKYYFIKLIDSIYKNVKSDYVINVVFSSIEEAKNIMQETNYDSKNLNVFVYNVGYDGKNHYTYQSEKKFFGLLESEYESCMILDSDFLFVGPTDLERDIADYRSLVVKNVPDNQFDRMVSADCNSLLGTDFDFFPLELPWIVDRNTILEMSGYLEQKNIDLKNMKTEKHIFEIILYRYYMCKNHPKEIEEIEVPFSGFIFDQKGDMKYKYAENKLVGGGSNARLIIHEDR